MPLLQSCTWLFYYSVLVSPLPPLSLSRSFESLSLQLGQFALLICKWLHLYSLRVTCLSFLGHILVSGGYKNNLLYVMDHVHAAWEVPSSLLPSIIHMVTQCSVLSMLLLLNYACRKKTLCCLRLCYSPSKKVASAAC